MKLTHKSVLIGGAVACVVLITSYHLAKQAVLGPKPFCHLSVDAALTEMMLARQKSGDQSLAYPNETGDSRKSIEVVAARIGATDAVHLRRDYAYVPGLKESDSAELILLYMREPTQFKWHGDHPSLFRSKRWLVITPGLRDSDRPGEWCPESGQWIATPEFSRRLEKTLSFLKENQRPYWERIVQEHQAFLAKVPH